MGDRGTGNGDMEKLALWGAGEIDHPGGTLLAHLGRTRDLLMDWAAPDYLVQAGLFHAAYATDGFAIPLLQLDQRDLLRDEIGVQAEAVVYFYASCDRSATYPTIGESKICVFRDRYAGENITPPDQDLRDFVELTMANELDLVAQNPDFSAQYGDGFRELFGGWLGLASDAAKAHYAAIFDT
jgi:hypothetical protein